MLKRVGVHVLMFLSWFGNATSVNYLYRPVPFSQKISAYKTLFSFGQEKVAINNCEISSFSQQLNGLDYTFNQSLIALTFGISQSDTLKILFPVASEHINGVKLKGLGNISLSIEHSIYTIQEFDAEHTLNGVCSILLPTAHTTRLGSLDVSLAQASTTFFIGINSVHASLCSYGYAACGVLFESYKYNTQYGNTYLYDIGVGIPLKKCQHHYYTLLLECNGRFKVSNKVNGIINDLSGSNRIWMGPVVQCIASDYTLSVGIQYPIVERFFAHRTKPSCRMALHCSYRFS